MKQILLSICVVMLCALTTLAQTNAQQTYTNADSSALFLIKHTPRFFVNIHSGYATALGSTFKFYPDDISSVSVEQVNNNTPVTTTKYKSSSKGLGEGFRYGAGLSYIVNDFINIGFEFDYFRSTISKTKDSSFHQVKNVNDIITDYSYQQHYTISYDATLLTLSPTITFKAISRPKFYIYNKIGAVITYRPNSIQKNIVDENMQTANGNNISDSSSQSYTRYEWGIKKPAFGFMGSVGAQYKLSENLRAFAEVQFSHIVFSVKNRVLTNYVVNKNDLTNTLPESAKVIEFENSFTEDQQNTNPNQPSISVVQRIPITYLGIQAGLAFRF
ncbi:MAG: hypothetical protein ABJB05_01240 [Parafilimonas sp.]